MGEVYAAEHLDHGRRVALKLLGRQLVEWRDRDRFLREGRLAASINHPNCVYVYGSEEIDGSPAISMELVAGGTLKDRLHDHGPLTPSGAVDIMLQVVAGLEAAHQAGIQHRDIKPSNCFVDLDGTVKVGDFGLSISTSPQEASSMAPGSFQGTPQFASPEQIRGEPVDLRSDIYAVGATLYCLLTGHAPFEAADLATLAERVKTEPARSPREHRPDIPRGLAAIVLRCLAKTPEARPATYASLRDELRPFGSTSITPVTLGRRLLAGAIDFALGFLVLWPLSSYAREVGSPRLQLWLHLGQIAGPIVYFGLLEGVWGGSLGKRALGLRVETAGGRAPSLLRALGRAVIFDLALQFVPLLIALFATARRRNGYAGLHEIATGTRVVDRQEPEVAHVSRDGADDIGPVLPDRRGVLQFPPYIVGTRLGSTDDGALFAAFDLTLRRSVWIHALPPDASPVPARLRDLNRPGRLRWLFGRRTEGQAWDAYEAPGGVPLVSLTNGARPWRVVRRWLDDLAQEIVTGQSTGSAPTLALDHVWIARNGHARFLDFRAPSMPSADESTRFESASHFLNAIATRTVDARLPLPLSASRLLDDLGRERIPAAAVIDRLRTASGGSDVVTVPRRAIHLAAIGLYPAALLGLLLIAARPPAPELVRLEAAVTEYLEQMTERLIHTRLDARDRRLIEVHVATRYGPVIAQPRTWRVPGEAPRLATDPYGVPAGYRLTADRIVTAHAAVSTEDATAADAAVARFREVFEAQAARTASPLFPAEIEQLHLFLRLLDAEPREALGPEQRLALEIYVAGRFGEAIRDDSQWPQPFRSAAVNDRQFLRLVARDALERHPRPSAQDLAAATATIEPLIAADRRALGVGSEPDDVLFDCAARLAEDPRFVRNLEVYIAGTFGAVIADAQTWTNRFPELGALDVRDVATRLVTRRSAVAAADLEQSRAMLVPLLADRLEFASFPREPSSAAATLRAVAQTMCVAGALLGLAAAFIARGGMMLRAFGFAVVTRTGTETSRLRALWRATIAWSPALVVCVLWLGAAAHWWFSFWFYRYAGELAIGALATLVAGAVWAVINPSRGLQDRLAGTWLVPR